MGVMITCDSIRITDGGSAGWEISNAVPSDIRNEKGQEIDEGVYRTQESKNLYEKKGAFV